MANRTAVAERLIGILSDDLMKHTSTYLAVLTNRIFAVGQRKIHGGSINGLFAGQCDWRRVANSESQALVSLQAKMVVQ
jgi:hypothetical protein